MATLKYLYKCHVPQQQTNNIELKRALLITSPKDRLHPHFKVWNNIIA